MKKSPRVLGLALRLGVAALSLGALSALGALEGCGSNGGEPCGVGGQKNGTCQSGPVCSSGQTEIPIVDPFDMCSGTGAVCCIGYDGALPDGATIFEAAPGHDGGSVQGDSRPPLDAHTTVDATLMDSGFGSDAPPPDTSTPPQDAHTHADAPAADGSHPPADAAIDSAVDAAHVDGHVGDAATHEDGGKDAATCQGAASCTLAATCAAQTTLCLANTCSDGCCGTSPAAAETVCTDHGGKVCDGTGSCVACVAPADCPAQTTSCVVATCTTHACGTMNATLGTPCTGTGGAVVCDGQGTCVASHCTDGVQDADETGVDCGGTECDGLSDTCGVGIGCKIAADCMTGDCSGGSCILKPNAGTCTTNGQCASNACVDGFCCNSACTAECSACSAALTGGANGTCAPSQNGTSCTNANACTLTSSCQTGACTGTTFVTCTAKDQCHTAGTCTAATGICTNPNATDGTSCNDGNVCDTNDACQSGVCTAGSSCATEVCGTTLTAFSGSNTTTWKMNGNASYDTASGTVVLVPGAVTTGEAGSVIYQDPIDANSFTATFDFRFTATLGRADGLMFMLETGGSNVIGQGFGGFGALGLTGYGVELDIFDSGPCDPGNGNHAGVDQLSACGTNGGIPSPLATSGDLFASVGPGDNGVGDIGDGGWRTAIVTLVGSSLSVSISDPITTAQVPVPNLQNVALPGFTPGASYYFGFGAGSGSNAQASEAEIRNVSIVFGASECL